MIRAIVIFTGVLCFAPAYAQNAHIIGIGDSLGEGDQSANAFSLSQQQGYLNRIAHQAKVPFTLPLIQSGPHGLVGLTNGRSRIDSSAHPLDLAVSGATVHDLLNDAAGRRVKNEVDLVLAPYTGYTQIQVVEQIKPGIVFCWIGNDDLINYVLDFTHLNAPKNITPIASFTSDYQSLISRLQATGAKVVVGNIPDLTKVGFLFNNDDVTRYLGQNYNLPAGSYTTLGAVVLIKLGSATPSILSDPAYVLTAEQLTRIRNQVESYNQVIATAAASAGYPVVNAFGIFDSFVTNPVVIEGVTVTNHFNGGAFSLDGIHPSDTGYVLFANAFIKAANSGYGLTIPTISASEEAAVVNADPFVDFNGNGIVPGRPGTGLLETLGPQLGISGDQQEHGAAITDASKFSKADPFSFMRAFYTAKGMNPETAWTKQDVINAVKEMFRSPQ